MYELKYCGFNGYEHQWAIYANGQQATIGSADLIVGAYARLAIAQLTANSGS